MEGIAVEVSQKLKSAIKAKLMELGAYVDEELSNYVMVMVTNRRSKAEMDRELQLFLGANTSAFTDWLQSVWVKLEHVRVANLGLENNKRKTEKKKKFKKIKNSSDSDEDKLKKKRKSSSVENNVKEVKKRKPLRNEETDITTLPLEENNKENTTTLKTLSEQKKSDGHLNIEIESKTKTHDLIFSNKKIQKDLSGIDEEDFLNIREDFESEFVSDNEDLPENEKRDLVTVDNSIKKILQKSGIEEKDKHLTPVSDIKHQKRKNINEKIFTVHNENVKIDNKDCPVYSEENKLINNSNVNPKIIKKKVITNDSARSRSRSVSRSKLYHSISPSVSKYKECKSRSRSVSPNEIESSKYGSRFQRVSQYSRSRSRSPISSELIKNLDESPIMDARELINRKRALMHATTRNETIISKSLSSVKKTNELNNIRSEIFEKDGTYSKIIFKDEYLKENYDIDEEKSLCLISKNLSSRYDRFVVNKNNGKLNIIQSGRDCNDEKLCSSVSNKSDKINLRGLKRTVFLNKNEENDEKVETIKLRQSVVNQIVKYIKDEPVPANNVPKSSKISRLKVTPPQQSASSTLIRKAVADAHKSFTCTKEESSKKKEFQENKCEVISKNKNLDDDNVVTVVELNSGNKDSLYNKSETKTEIVEIISPDSSRNMDDKEDDINCNTTYLQDNNSIPIDKINETEEYDPSENMPQFVVTLTGLNNSQLYTQNENDLQEILNTEINKGDGEDSKIQSNSQERCKYYPNCLVGEQCLFYHPSISCKMFPNCKFGDGCLFVHPKCKFDTLCTRFDCQFFHTAARIIPGSTRHVPTSTIINAQPCKFYYNCVNPICPFQHPKICRFDRYCLNKNCNFSHTSLSHVTTISKDKLKWSKPKDNENKVE